MLPSRPHKFTYSELYSATQRFSSVHVLASDARGVLYRGTLTNGCHVAVKRFSTQFLGSSHFDWARVLRRIGEITQVILEPSACSFILSVTCTFLSISYLHEILSTTLRD